MKKGNLVYTRPGTGTTVLSAETFKNSLSLWELTGTVDELNSLTGWLHTYLQEESDQVLSYSKPVIRHRFPLIPTGGENTEPASIITPDMWKVNGIDSQPGQNTTQTLHFHHSGRVIGAAVFAFYTYFAITFDELKRTFWLSGNTRLYSSSICNRLCRLFVYYPRKWYLLNKIMKYLGYVVGNDRFYCTFAEKWKRDEDTPGLHFNARLCDGH